MGLKKSFKKPLYITLIVTVSLIMLLIILTASYFVWISIRISIGFEIEKDSVKLNEQIKDFEVMLYNPKESPNSNGFINGSILEENFEDLCVYYDSKLYGVSRGSSIDSESEMYIKIFDTETRTYEEINIGKFGDENHESVAARHLSFPYSEFHNEHYLHPEWSETDEHLNEYYKYSTASTYYNGGIYVKDVNHTVRYDVLENKIIENPSDASLAFTLNYTFLVSDDGNSVTICEVATGTKKVVTLESILNTASPEIKQFVEKWKGNDTGYDDGRTSTEKVFKEFEMREIDGALYVTIKIYNDFGFSLPIIFRYDFDNDYFKFCVAGNCDTCSLPITVMR